MKSALFGIVAGAALLGACNTSNTDDDLVGTWQRLHEDTTVRDRYVFRADGSFTFDEFKPDEPTSEDHVTGTYTASDDTIVVSGTNAKDGARTQGTITYYANATMFATQAFRPTGANAGIVGTWTATFRAEFPDEPARPAEGGTATYAFRADGTFTLTGKRADGTSVDPTQGTYLEVTPGFFQVTATGETVGRTLQMLDDAALVFPTRIFSAAE